MHTCINVKKVTLIFKTDFSGRCGCMRMRVCPFKRKQAYYFQKNKTKNKDQIALIHRIQLSFFWNAYALFQFGSQQVEPKHPQSQKLHILDRAIWQFDLNPIPSLHHWLIDMNLRHCPHLCSWRIPIRVQLLWRNWCRWVKGKPAIWGWMAGVGGVSAAGCFNWSIFWSNCSNIALVGVESGIVLPWACVWLVLLWGPCPFDFLCSHCHQ